MFKCSIKSNHKVKDGKKMVFPFKKLFSETKSGWGATFIYKKNVEENYTTTYPNVFATAKSFDCIFIFHELHEWTQISNLKNK